MSIAFDLSHRVGVSHHCCDSNEKQHLGVGTAFSLFFRMEMLYPPLTLVLLSLQMSVRQRTPGPPSCVKSVQKTVFTSHRRV